MFTLRSLSNGRCSLMVKALGCDPRYRGSIPLIFPINYSKKTDRLINAGMRGSENKRTFSSMQSDRLITGRLQVRNPQCPPKRVCDGKVDRTDLKSVGSNPVGVQIPSHPPLKKIRGVSTDDRFNSSVIPSIIFL